MSWTDWLILGIVTAGFIMFLLGANASSLWNQLNNYDATAIGWAGIVLFIGGIVFYIIIFIYRAFKRSPVL